MVTASLRAVYSDSLNSSLVATAASVDILKCATELKSKSISGSNKKKAVSSLRISAGSCPFRDCAV